jgi:hypothetical protein
MLTNPNDWDGFGQWVICSSGIYIASFLGGLLGLQWIKIRTLAEKNEII